MWTTWAVCSSEKTSLNNVLLSFGLLLLLLVSRKLSLVIGAHHLQIYHSLKQCGKFSSDKNKHLYIYVCV